MRRPILPLVAALGAAALAAAGLALAAVGASTTKLSAKLVPRAERPLPKAAGAAAGSFTGTLTGSTLSWRLTFSHLTGKAVAAHIHLGRPGTAGPVAVPLCGPCSSGAHGTAKLTAKVRSALLSGGAYVNVHTTRNQGGEIRGQITGGTAAAPASTSGTTTTSTTPGGYGGYG